MKMQIFYEETCEIQAIINQWLNNKKLKIISIQQSSYSKISKGYNEDIINDITIISIFYENIE